MAIDDKDGGGETIRSRAAALFGDSDDEQPNGDGDGDAYDWVDFRREFHDEGAFDRSEYLGFDPHRIADIVREHAGDAKTLNRYWKSFLDPETTPVVKGTYLWEHYKQEYYYEPDGSVPRDRDGKQIPFDESDHLGFEPDETEGRLSHGQNLAGALADLVDERTVDVNEAVDEDAFFSTFEGHTTVVNRYDLERAVPMEKKRHFEEVDRYWVNKPYACVILFHSKKENERKYYVVEPALNDIERELKEFLGNKLKTAIKYAEEGVGVEDDEAGRAAVIEREAQDLLARYDIYEDPIESGAGTGSTEWLKGLVGMGAETDAIEPAEETSGLDGIAARPEPAILAEDPDTLSEYQVEKLLYLLKRDYIGYGKIDPIKHDINVEDISCDGYNSRVFAYHTDYEQIITNVEHGESDLDDFVVKLAQRSGKGISKRQPQVDATLPDGSRAQLTLGREVSDHGTNYTIRQFKDVPFTPVDLINWNTFSLDEMAFLWLAIENNKSMIFAGGTASGKTTSLNAISLFIPSNAKIVSIEDTREVELPQRNWVASVTRPSFGEDETGDIDEFDLLEAALRQRPDYIVMGEVRGEEGRDLFQVMSTGHTGYSTFHADTVGEVAKEFQSIVLETTYFDTDYRTAIRNQAVQTPSDELSQFLTDMLSIVDSGGDMTSFLEDQKNKYMRTSKQTQERMLETLELFGEMYMTLSLFPLLLIIILVVMSMMGNASTQLMYITVYGLIPMINVAFLVLVSTVTSDESSDGFLLPDDPKKRAQIEGETNLFSLGLIEQYTGGYNIFDRINDREGTHQVIEILRAPHIFLRDNPPYVLALTVPITLVALMFAVLMGWAPTSLSGMQSDPLQGTFFWLYVPAYINFIPLAIFHEWNVRYRRSIIGKLSENLRKLSSANETGMTLLESLNIVAQTSSGRLAEEFSIMHRKVNYGTNLKQALREFNNKYHVPRLSRTVKLISEAQEASNQIQDVLSTAAQASENQDDIDRDRKSRTRMQVVIIIMTFLTLLGVIAMLKVQFFETMAGLSSQASGSSGAMGGQSFGSSMPSNDMLSMLFFHAVSLQAIFSAVIAGYIRNVRIVSGLKYAVALLTVSLVVWMAVGG